MRMGKIIFCLAFSLFFFSHAAEEEKALSVWQLANSWPRHAQLRRELVLALREGDPRRVETVCRSAIAAFPADSVWHYNLACALSRLQQHGLALTELDKAIGFGFRDSKAIARDHDFDPLRKFPRFTELVEKAQRLAGVPVEGMPVVKPITAKPGQRITLDETSTAFNYDVGCLQALVRLDCAGKGGNAGDLYVNHDGGHSTIAQQEFPDVTFVGYNAAARSYGIDSRLPMTLFPPEYAVFGNISRARVDGPLWRSLPRSSFTDPGLAPTMDLLYRNNQLWFLVAHKDFGHEGIGDVFPAVAPFQFVSRGSSWSDLPFLKAALRSSAALKPVTRAAMLRRHLYGPTFQWLFRRSLLGVDTERDYLSEKAHPTVFEEKRLNVRAMVDRAAALDPGDVPPAVALALINCREKPVKYPAPLVDYPDTASELLSATPSSIAIVLRAPEGVRTFLCKATVWPEKDPSATFAWRVVHGDAECVKFDAPPGSASDSPENSGLVRIVLDRRALTNRIDVACFARSGKGEFGAPSFLSFYPVPQERREYLADGRIGTIDYTNPSGIYCDPVIALPRHWVDVYDYGPDGDQLGWTRFYNGRAAASFTTSGDRILEKNEDGTAKRAVHVKYVIRQTNDRIQPMQLTYVDEGEPFDVKRGK